MVNRPSWPYIPCHSPPYIQLLEDKLELNLLHLMLDIIIKEVGLARAAVGPTPSCVPIVGYKDENDMLSMTRMDDIP